MTVEDKTLVELGWRALSGALDTFKKAGVTQKVIVGGDISLLQERMAVASSTGIRVSDEAASAGASITAMLETEEAKGSGWIVGTELSERGVVPEEAGRAAAASALSSRMGERIDSGEYTVVLSPQAVGDLLSHIILPSLNLAVMDAAGSTFQGKLRQRVADPRFSLYDHGALAGKADSRRFTCEGLPTGKTLLIDRGKLVGFLTNDYYSKKMLKSPDAREKLGADPGDFPGAFVPRNGFRSGESLGRNFMVPPSIVPSNVIVEGSETLTNDRLLERVGNGVYVGRIWYTYPMNGLGPGDFTSTIVGDSFLIRNGRKDRPLKPNAVRFHENIHRILENILGFGDTPRSVLLWGSPEVIDSPEIAVSQVRLEAIAS
jgi:PmbA protein